MSDKYIEYKGETYEQALEVLERHAITKLVDRDGVSYVASMIAMFEGVEHMQAERIAALEADNAALRARADKLAAAGQGLAEALMNDHALNDALETWDAALQQQAERLAEALEEAREHIKLYVSLRNLPRHAQNPGSKPLILVDIDAALADWRKGE